MRHEGIRRQPNPITVSLFRVFQTLYKQGDWFSFSKRRAPSLVCIDDNRSCMKHWKCGFFFIDRRAILGAMVWRHPDAAIDDPRPAAGSFNMADVRRLRAHVIKLRDMPEGVLVLSSYGPPASADAVIPEPAPEDLVVGTLSSKIVAKAEASRNSTTQTSLFVGDGDESDDDDACVEIPLVTPLRKGIMVDDAATSSAGVSRSRPSFGPAPSFKDVSGDAIHTDFFLFSVVYWEESRMLIHEYFGDLTKEVFKDPSICKTIIDRFPTLGEMVRVESLSDDQLTAKMSVLHCMMMAHGGELLARYRGLNQSHHEYVLSADSRLKGYEEKVANMTGLELQVSALKNPRLRGRREKKKIKSLTKSLDNMHAEVARLSASLNQATILEAKRDEEILQLKTTPLEFSSFFRGQFQGLVRKFLSSDEFSRVLGELISLAASTGFDRGLSMHRTKDEFADALKNMVN
ncbi:hypothetical protein Tco_0541099, partial [Tanacetum coccineum]